MESNLLNKVEIQSYNKKKIPKKSSKKSTKNPHS